MSNTERYNVSNEALEAIQETQIIPADEHISIAYHPHFARYHPHFYSMIIKELRFSNGNSEALYGRRYPLTHTDAHSDQTPFLSVIRTTNQPSNAVIVPFWFGGAETEKQFFAVSELGNAFTQSASTEDDIITDRLIAVGVFVELRQDKNTPSNLRGYTQPEKHANEAVLTQMLASTMSANGYTDVILDHPHSKESVDHFKNAGLEVLCISPAAMWAKHIIDTAPDLSNVHLGALDIGGLQIIAQTAQIIYELTEVKVSVSAGHKRRPDKDVIEEYRLIYGAEDIRGKDVYLGDDIYSSGTSYITGSNVMEAHGAESITGLFSHGVFAGSVDRNFSEIRMNEKMRNIVVGNTHPEAERVGSINQDIMEIEEQQKLIATIARAVALSSVEEVENDPILGGFTFDPIDKLKFIEEFTGYAIEELEAQAGFTA